MCDSPSFVYGMGCEHLGIFLEMSVVGNSRAEENKNNMLFWPLLSQSSTFYLWDAGDFKNGHPGVRKYGRFC